MLRTVLIGIGTVALLCGLAALATGAFPPAMVFGMWGAILVLAVLVERFRYKPLAASRPGPGWQRTTERFVDDETGQNVTVYVEPGTGERAYVRD